MDISSIIQFKFPSANLMKNVTIQDDGNGAYIKKWDNSLGPKPTQEELDLWSVDAQKDLDYQLVVKTRQSLYPPIGDQLDAILKQLNLLQTKDPALQEIIDKWQAVKNNNPLPTPK